MAGVFYGLSILLAQAQQTLIADLMHWLAIINVILALFNLIPGFPLDGGRVFRAIIWRRTGNYHRATRLATKVGQGIAYAFVAGGMVIIFVAHLWLNGLWLIFIGWFLHDAARATYQQTLLRRASSGVKVRHVTDYRCPFVSPKLNLERVVQEYILPTGRNCFPVARETLLEGMITLYDLKKIPRIRWDTTTVQDIMTPVNKLKTVHPDQDILSLLQEMGKTDHIPVVEEGKVIGILNREDLNRFLRTRVDLEMKLRP
jgi:CBS domain-containing protein